MRLCRVPALTEHGDEGQDGWGGWEKQSFKVHHLPALLLFSSLSAVNLLDTTTIMGDWGWLTYPSHGVRKLSENIFTEQHRTNTKDKQL